MEDLDAYFYSCADPLPCMEDVLVNSLDADFPWNEDTAFRELEQVPSPSSLSPPEFELVQQPEAYLMPHQESFQRVWWDKRDDLQFLLDNAPENDCEVCDDSSNEAPASFPSKDIDNEENKKFGWTEEDNETLSRIVFEVMGNKPLKTFHVSEAHAKRTWDSILKEYNARTGQNRSKIQLYSHFSYCFKNKRMPSYLKAEEQLLLALDELGVPTRMMSCFLKNPRSEELLVKKLDKLKEDPNKSGHVEMHFRNSVKRAFKLRGGLDSLKNGKLPKKDLIEDVKSLVVKNPSLKKKYNAIKPAGRPRKKTKMVPVTQQLKTLFRPFIYISKRRKRTSSLAGDGRKYGLNLFCLNRLLGSPFEIDKMPIEEEEALKVGVDASDYRQYAVLRELMLKHAGIQPEANLFDEDHEIEQVAVEPGAYLKDRFNYADNPGNPPAVSVLPPTLTTLTGMRGLLCYRETLLTSNDEELDENQNVMDENSIGDSTADEKLERFLSSMFQTSWNLVEKSGEPDDNSDGDTDSDDEVCFGRYAPVKQHEGNKASEAPQEDGVAAEFDLHNPARLENPWSLETQTGLEHPDEAIMREIEAEWF